MADLGAVAWPPEPIKTERLVLREPAARDRAALIELQASPEVGAYLEAGLRRSRAIRSLGRRAVARPAAPGDAARLSSCSSAVVRRRNPLLAHRPRRGIRISEHEPLFLAARWGDRAWKPAHSRRRRRLQQRATDTRIRTACLLICTITRSTTMTVKQRDIFLRQRRLVLSTREEWWPR